MYTCITADENTSNTDFIDLCGSFNQLFRASNNITVDPTEHIGFTANKQGIEFSKIV